MASSQTWSRSSADISSVQGSSEVQHITQGLDKVRLQSYGSIAASRSVSTSSAASVASTSSTSSKVSRSSKKIPWFHGSNHDYERDEVVPGHRAPYVPRYAARGFLSTTSGVAGSAR